MGRVLISVLPREDYDRNVLVIAGGLAFSIAQAVTMVLVAMLLPGSDGAYLSFISKLLEIVIANVDLVFLYLAISYSARSRDFKYVGIALGWAWTESLFSRTLPIVYAGKGYGFEWTPILLGLEANGSMLLAVACTQLLHIYRLKRASFFVIAAVVSRSLAVGLPLWVEPPLWATCAYLLVALISFLGAHFCAKW